MSPLKPIKNPLKRLCFNAPLMVFNGESDKKFLMVFNGESNKKLMINYTLITC